MKCPNKIKVWQVVNIVWHPYSSALHPLARYFNSLHGKLTKIIFNSNKNYVSDTIIFTKHEIPVLPSVLPQKYQDILRHPPGGNDKALLKFHLNEHWYETCLKHTQEYHNHQRSPI